MAPIADAREALVGGLTAEEPDVAVADCQPPPPSRYWPVRVQVRHIPARQSVIDMGVETARHRALLTAQAPSAAGAALPAVNVLARA